MKIPFHINVNLEIDYDMSNDDRASLKEAVERVLFAMGADIKSIAAGPYQESD